MHALSADMQLAESKIEIRCRGLTRPTKIALVRPIFNVTADAFAGDEKNRIEIDLLQRPSASLCIICKA